MFPVVILAGGLATRLGKLTEKIPKSLLRINNEPFLYWQLKLLEEYEFTEVYLLISHFENQILDFIGDGSKFNLKINHISDGEIPLGTGGAILKNLSKLPEKFFLLYGDSYLDIDYSKMEKYYMQGNFDFLMGICSKKGQYNFTPNVVFSSGKVQKYSKNKDNSSMEYEDFGVSLISKSVFLNFKGEEYKDLGSITSVLADQGTISGYLFEEKYYEVGSEIGISLTTKYLREKYGIHK
jgi:NDP-sugar pyrophosphorylase family protein